MKANYWSIVKDYSGIIIGTLIVSLGLDLFLIPNKIAAGGVSGLGTIIYYLTKIPVGTTILIVNIPLLFVQWRRWGTAMVLRTAFGIVIFSLFLDLLPNFIQPWTRDPLLACIYGGLVCGVGTGIIFNFRGSAGGSALLAQLLHNKIGLSVGRTMLAIDAVVIVLAGLVFNVEIALYAMIAVFVSGKVVDVIQDGLSYNKAVLIFCNDPSTVGRQLIEEVSRGVSAFPCRGLYTGGQREALLCVVAQSEIAFLRKVVYNLDPNAFLVVANCNEVLGEGFGGLKEKAAKF